MVWRERTEKVAFLDTIARMAGALLNVNADKVFSPLIREYEREVFQETYNADLLRQKAALLRAAQERVKGRRLHDVKMIRRLDALGDFYDQELGPDLKPLPRDKPARKPKKR